MVPPPLAAIRLLVCEQIDETSLRHVAAQIGISPTTLRKFADGDDVLHYVTRRKLEYWFGRNAPPPVLKVTVLGDVLNQLVEELPPDEQPRARRAVLDELARLYRDNGVAPPDWIAVLRLSN